MPRFTIAVLLSSAYLACATQKVTYRWGNMAYDSPEAALSAEEADISKVLTQITPVDATVARSAILVLPSRAFIRDKLVTIRGGAQSSPERTKSLDFVISSQDKQHRAFGEALKRRRLFDQVAIETSDDPEHAVAAADVVIVLTVKEKSLAWLVRTDAAGPLRPVGEISPDLPPVRRNVVWLERIEKMARGG